MSWFILSKKDMSLFNRGEEFDSHVANFLNA